jgi:membrane protein YqaA with SNARE-associated domain
LTISQNDRVNNDCREIIEQIYDINYNFGRILMANFLLKNAKLKLNPMIWLKRMYDWVLSWAEHPAAVWALFILAFAESSFFPVPPDVLLIALCISKPRKSFYYALICTLGSSIGGLFGYLIGYEFFEVVGKKIIDFYGLSAEYKQFQDLFLKYQFWAVGVAGFSPIPYKLATIASGLFKMKIIPFFIISFLTRGARFFLVGGLIYKFGMPVKVYIEKYFDLLALLFVVLLILGFVVLKWIM